MWEVRYRLPVTLVVTVDAATEDEALDRAGALAEDHMLTMLSTRSVVQVEADTDGIGASDVREIRAHLTDN